MSETISTRRVERVRHEVKRRELEVLRVETVSPSFRRVTLTAASLADFVSASFDDHVKLILGTAGAEPVMRDYTPARFDTLACELDIEFALHGDGPAANWAAQAEVGQRVTIGGPRGSFVVPTDFAWHLLVGDETALPAIARRLHELPSGVRAIVRVAVAEPGDRRALVSAADLDLAWLDEPASLIGAVRSITLPAGQGYAWCAGEASVVAQLRKILVDEKGHDRGAIRAAAYWKQGAVAHHENLDG